MLPMDLLQTNNNDKYCGLGGVSGITVTGVTDVDYGERGDSYQNYQ